MNKKIRNRLNEIINRKKHTDNSTNSVANAIQDLAKVLAIVALRECDDDKENGP